MRNKIRREKLCALSVIKYVIYVCSKEEKPQGIIAAKLKVSARRICEIFKKYYIHDADLFEHHSLEMHLRKG